MDETKTGILPVARTDLPPEAPWWAKYLAVKISEGWKLLSVNVPIICGVVIEISTTFGDLIPKEWMPHLATLALWATAILRFVNQKKPE